jgi:tetratricopeptide (TPR) repeat protein
MSKKESVKQVVHICANCGTRCKDLRCGKCKLSYYCGSACQREHWNEHKPKCKIWRIEAQKQAAFENDSMKNLSGNSRDYDQPSTPYQFNSWSAKDCNRTSKIAASLANRTELAFDPNTECAICLEHLLRDAVAMACGHSFHRKCVTQLRTVERMPTCPLCRVQLPPGPDETMVMVQKLIMRSRFKREIVNVTVGGMQCDMPGPQDPAVEQRYTREAMLLLEQLLAEHPSNHPANFTYGMLLCQGYHNYDEAIAPLRRAISSFPSDYSAHGLLAKSLDILGDTDGAFTHYKTALSIQPNDVFANWFLGKHFVRHRFDLDSAIGLFTRALAVDPHHGACMVSLAKAHSARNEAKEAIQWYQRALLTTFVESPNCDYVPNDDEEIHYNLGSLLFRQGDVDGAIVSYKNAVMLSPDSACDSFNQATLATALLRGKDDFHGSMNIFNTALACLPPPGLRCSLYFDFGCCLESGNYVLQAVECYRKAMEMAHLVKADTPRILTGVAFKPRLRLVQGLARVDVDGAVSSFQDMLQVESDSDDVKIAARALDAAMTARARAGLISIENILSKLPVPIQCSIMFDVGVGRREQHNDEDDDGAIEAWKMVVRLQPDHAGAQGRLCERLASRARWREGYRSDYIDAIAAGLAHTELMPDDYLAHWYYGGAIRCYIQHVLRPEIQQTAHLHLSTFPSISKFAENGKMQAKEASELKEKAMLHFTKLLDQVDAMKFLAVRAYERALVIDTTDVSLYLAMNNLLTIVGDHESSLAWFAAAIRVDYDVASECLKCCRVGSSEDAPLNEPGGYPAARNPRCRNQIDKAEAIDWYQRSLHNGTLDEHSSRRWPSLHDAIKWPDGYSKFRSKEKDFQLLEEVGGQLLERKRMSCEDPVSQNHWQNSSPGPRANFLCPPRAGGKFKKAVLRFTNGTVPS